MLGLHQLLINLEAYSDGLVAMLIVHDVGLGVSCS
jgi:hypothetical protein